MVERKATAKKPYQYLLSGLSNVFLSGITVRECHGCGTASPIIPRVGELHSVIAECLIGQAGPLSGEQIRFLRKYAGFPAKDLAVILGITPEHLSRVENGKTKKLGDLADTIVRVLAMDRKRNGTVAKVLMELAQKLIAGKETGRCTSGTVEVRMNKACEWKVAA